MVDELTGAPAQISSQSATAAKRTLAAQRAVGALCNESGSTGGSSSGRTALQDHHAGVRRVGEGPWRSTHAVGQEAR